jgi:hypothetical protein
MLTVRRMLWTEYCRLHNMLIRIIRRDVVLPPFNDRAAALTFPAAGACRDPRRSQERRALPCRRCIACRSGCGPGFSSRAPGGGRARLDRSGARPLRALIENWRAPERQGALSRHEARLRGVGAQHGTRLAAAVAGPVVQRFPGHSDFRTTQRYVHLADDELQRAAEHLKL